MGSIAGITLRSTALLQRQLISTSSFVPDKKKVLILRSSIRGSSQLEQTIIQGKQQSSVTFDYLILLSNIFYYLLFYLQVFDT